MLDITCNGVEITTQLQVGQLLVVVHHTDTSPSLCYEPELIPDPLAYAFMRSALKYLVNGPGISLE